MRITLPGFLLLAAVGVGRAAEPPKLAEIAPRASGIALVEVTKVTPYDERPGDGNKGVRFTLKRLRGSGHFRDTIDVATDFGGFNPSGVEPKPSLPVRPDTLKKGGRYWVAFASEEQWTEFNQGVIGTWTEKDKVAEAFEAAIKEDAYRWHPQYDPETKLTYGFRTDKGKWWIRVEKDGKLLWEREVPGEKIDGWFSFGFWDNTGDDFPAKFPPCHKLFIAMTRTDLPKDNELGLPPGPYHVNTGFDPENGKRYAAWATKAQIPIVELVRREYDPDSGKPRREERFDFPATGGNAAGAKTENWWRKIARTFDVQTGKVTKEEVFRYDVERAGDRWVKVGK